MRQLINSTEGTPLAKWMAVRQLINLNKEN